MVNPISNNSPMINGMGDESTPPLFSVGGLVMGMNLINALPTSGSGVKNLGAPGGPLYSLFQSMAAGLSQEGINADSGTAFGDGLAELNNGNIGGAQSLIDGVIGPLASVAPPPLTLDEFKTIVGAIGNIATSGNVKLIDGSVLSNNGETFMYNMVAYLTNPIHAPANATPTKLTALTNILNTLKSTIESDLDAASTVEGYVAMASNMYEEMCG